MALANSRVSSVGGLADVAIEAVRRAAKMRKIGGFKLRDYSQKIETAERVIQAALLIFRIYRKESKNSRDSQTGFDEGAEGLRNSRAQRTYRRHL